ncbi:MAG: isoamylase early set domain-containing protein [bacterium]
MPRDPRDDEDLPQPLRRATELLRELPPVREQWRRDFDDSLADDREMDIDRGNRFTRRGWTVTPLTAIAACLLCAVLGGAVVATLHRSGDTSQTASVKSPSPASQSGLNVRFDLVAPGASQVAIVGDFNQWNAESLPMRRSADGTQWEIEVRLPPGRYTYGFVVDGKLTRDPRAPEGAGDDFGIPNSVRMVSRAGGSL